MARFRATGVVLACALAALAASAFAATGELSPKADTAACVSEDGTSDGTVATAGECADGTALEPRSVTVSPDGRNVYAASGNRSAINVFDRDPATGAITQKPGIAGCIQSGVAPTGCDTSGLAVFNPIDITVSPDGLNVYVAALGADAVLVFDRDPATGALTQKTGNGGADGCISETGAGACADGRGLDAATGVIVSPDGDNVYVSSTASGGVAVFDREPGGALTQDLDTDGCISDDGAPGCANGRGLSGATSLVISPGGTSIYVSAANDDVGIPDTLAVLSRDPATGDLSQADSPAACFSDTGSGGLCTAGTGLDGAEFLAISPDGDNVYVTGSLGVTDGSIAIFDRAGSGALTQKAGALGCIRDDGSGGCADGVEVDRPRGVAVSPDGATVYVSGFDSGSVAVFDRDASTGALTQKPGSAGCVSETGSGGSCSTAKVLAGGLRPALSPDGTSLYVGALFDDAVAVFDRDDGAAPDTLIVSGPAGRTTRRSATFTFTASEPGASFECRLDAGAFTPCSSPKSYGNLAFGAHAFRVRATDRSDNADGTAALRTFTVVRPDISVSGSATARRRQSRKGDQIVIVIRVRAGEPLSVRAGGRVKVGPASFPLTSIRRQLASGARPRLRLTLRRADHEARVGRALKDGGRATAAVSVRLRDRAGNAKAKPLRVELR